MASRVTGRHISNLFLLLLALSGMLAASNSLPEDNDPQDTAAPQADPVYHQQPSSDVDLTPTSIATYIAELIGTLAGLVWGLYASLPTFG